jgi:gliding motility-associated-like protein
MRILFALIIAFAVHSLRAQCDVYVVDGSATYEDLDPGVVFTFDIQNDDIVPYNGGQFHLGFGLVTSQPVWYFTLDEPLQPGESITVTTPIFDIPTPDNFADWPMWDQNNLVWNGSDWEFHIYLNYCNFNAVFLDNVAAITDGTCPNDNNDQFCNWCNIEVIDFTFPEVTLYAVDVDYCATPWASIQSGAMYLFQVEFIPEPGQIPGINNAAIVPDLYTGDTATYNLLDIAGIYADEITQLWEDSCELSIRLDFPNNLPQIGFDTTLVYSTLPCLLPCDTVFVTDTLEIYITDTLEVEVFITDTIQIVQVDTLYIYETIYEVDTIYVTEIEHIYHTDTITEYIVETVYIDCFTGLPCEGINGLCDETSIFVPNAFTPNNDGVNDVFMAETDPNCWLTWKFQIYNRWGSLVWESSDPEDYWLGGNVTYVADGTYVWAIQATTQGGGVELSGHVTVLR